MEYRENIEMREIRLEGGAILRIQKPFNDSYIYVIKFEEKQDCHYSVENYNFTQSFSKYAEEFLDFFVMEQKRLWKTHKSVLSTDLFKFYFILDYIEYRFNQGQEIIEFAKALADSKILNTSFYYMNLGFESTLPEDQISDWLLYKAIMNREYDKVVELLEERSIEKILR